MDGKLHRRDKKYAETHEQIIHDLRLSDGAVRLYGHMQIRYGGEHKANRLSMADALGVSEKTISNRVRELEATGWIVVVEHDLDPQTGKFQTPFYHVFETRGAAKLFRETYTCAEGERIRPRPTLKARRSRKGVGGKRTAVHTAGTQVPTSEATEGTQVLMVEGNPENAHTEGTQVPTSLNSLKSRESTGSLGPESCESQGPEERDKEQKNQDSSGPEGPEEKGKREKSRATREFSLRDRAKDRDALLAAARFAFDLKASNFGYAQRLVNFLTGKGSGRATKWDEFKIEQDGDPVDAIDIAAFRIWYFATYRDQKQLPQSPEVLNQRFEQFRAAQKYTLARRLGAAKLKELLGIQDDPPPPPVYVDPAVFEAAVQAMHARIEETENAKRITVD